MKKSLLAFAVLGAFAGATSAQNNVTLYGVVDMGVNYDNGRDAAGRTWSLTSGQLNGSRFGFRGIEDLGGGMSAIFNLENGFNADDGTLTSGGRLFGRQAWVGLNGGFGSVKLGRQYTTLFNALLAIDPFGVNQAGDLQRIYGYGLGRVEPLGRSDNTIIYSTPKFGGIGASVGYKFGETAGSFNSKSSKFAGVDYASGPINVMFAYINTDGIAFAPAAGTTAAVPSAALAAIVAPTGLDAVTANANVRSAFLGAVYDFGVVKAHLGFGDTKLSALGEAKIRNYMVGVTAPLGADSVYASWNRNDIKELASGTSHQYAIGYVHPLSKRTSLHSSLGYTKNDAGVRLNAATNGASDREFQLGVRHLF
ncbi:MAG: porin [Herbaspirillum sp.]|nr:porin [Herbaspirillum sp.]